MKAHRGQGRHATASAGPWDTQHRSYIVLDLLVEDADRAIWRFEMRDEVRPSVLLGHALQLNLIELRKADRLGIGTGALADWIALFEHWREEHTMSQIAYESVRAAR